MSTVTLTIEEAARDLSGVIHRAFRQGDRTVLTEAGKPVAEIVPVRQARHRRQPGSAKGKLTILADDDDHLVDFKEYLP